MWMQLRGVVAACVLAAALPARGAGVEGVGASFPSQVYAKWAQTFEKATGKPVRYQPTGSSDGVKQITARAVQFGGSDSPLPPEELSKRQLVQVPMLVGGIVPVVNLQGLGDKRLHLTGEVLAAIMVGEVRHWNDPRIVALNPGVSLPAHTIRRIVRADKSGTTEGLTRYLAGVSSAFKRDVGVGQQPSWPGEVERAEGNDGMVRSLKARNGAIAYVSYDRAEQDRLATVKLKNASGNWVAASEAGFRAALLESDVSRRGDDAASIIDRTGSASWPITMASFVLFDAEPAKAQDVNEALRFLYWCFVRGDDLTRGTGFAPLPTSLQSRLAARFMAVKPQDGKVPDFLSP